jgi:hypothetical protein
MALHRAANAYATFESHDGHLDTGAAGQRGARCRRTNLQPGGSSQRHCPHCPTAGRGTKLAGGNRAGVRSRRTLQCQRCLPCRQSGPGPAPDFRASRSGRHLPATRAWRAWLSPRCPAVSAGRRTLDAGQPRHRRAAHAALMPAASMGRGAKLSAHTFSRTS